MSQLETFLSGIDRKNHAEIDLSRNIPTVLVESEVGPVGLRLARSGQGPARLEFTAPLSIPMITQDGLKDPDLCAGFMASYHSGQKTVDTTSYYLEPSTSPVIWYVAVMRFEFAVRDRVDVGLAVWSPGPVQIIPTFTDRSRSIRQMITSRFDVNR